MKKLFWAIIPFMLMLSACSDDDDKNSIPSDHPILGTWILSDYGAEIECNNNSLSGLLNDIFVQEYNADGTGQRGSSITFNKNGKVSIEDYPSGIVVEARFKIDGTILTVTANKEKLTNQFEIAGNKLHLITNILKECKQIAVSKGYDDEIYSAEFVETFTAL